MVVGFTTTYAISAYHHWCCEFESHSGWRVQHYVIKLVSDLPQVGGFPRVIRFPLPIKLTGTIFITEILLKLGGVVTIYTMYLLVLDLCNTVLSSGKLWWLELHMGGAINSTGWNNPSVAPDLTSCCGIPFYIRAIALLFYLMSHLTHLCTQTWYSRSKASNICIIPVEFCGLNYLIMRMIRELWRFVRVRGFGEILLTDIANVCTGACYDFYFFSEYSKNHKGGI
jgi:hypothetical protein